MIKNLSEFASELANKTVIVRLNLDVPITNQTVLDTTRVEANLATIRLLLENHCRLLLIAHQGRPEGKYQADASLQPIIPLLNRFLSLTVNLIPYNADFKQIALTADSPINLLENLRFWPQEESNDPSFSQHLANLAQVYVNEAFANCHRSHASIVGLPKLIPSYAGLCLSQEISILEKVTKDPKKPLVIVIGGAKLETKEPLVNKFASLADAILVGGKIAADLSHKSQMLPANVYLANLTPDKLDITEDSAQSFAQIIASAGTVIWNGTMGVFEKPSSQQGTKIVAQAINQTAAYTLVGGGDTETALTNLQLESGIDHISTGGGAMLEYLINGSLPGLDALSYAPNP